MKLKVINIEGKKVDDIEISDKIFSLKPNENLIQSLIDWQLNHFKARIRVSYTDTLSVRM